MAKSPPIFTVPPKMATRASLIEAARDNLNLYLDRQGAKERPDWLLDLAVKQIDRAKEMP